MPPPRFPILFSVGELPTLGYKLRMSNQDGKESTYIVSVMPGIYA